MCGLVCCENVALGRGLPGEVVRTSAADVNHGSGGRCLADGTWTVYHHREDRIRAHVQLCWLALLLTRGAETRAGDTWRNLRHELDRMHLVTLATAHGRVAQRSALTSGHKTILAALDRPNRPATSTSHPATTLPPTDNPAHEHSVV